LFDGNGNVVDVLDKEGNAAAHYEYDPFGRTIVATGPMAKENKFRFSTKYFVDEIGLGDWGMRWYHPDTGRWLSRDPIGEMRIFPSVFGSPSYLPSFLSFHLSTQHIEDKALYMFVGNNPISSIDLFGLIKAGDVCCCEPPANIDATIYPEIAYDFWLENKVIFTKTGCWEDLHWKWWSCSYGLCCPDSDRWAHAVIPSIWPIRGDSPLLLSVRYNYLSCEDHKWVRKVKSFASPKSWIWHTSLLPPPGYWAWE